VAEHALATPPPVLQGLGNIFSSCMNSLLTRRAHAGQPQVCRSMNATSAVGLPGTAARAPAPVAKTDALCSPNGTGTALGLAHVWTSACARRQDERTAAAARIAAHSSGDGGIVNPRRPCLCHAAVSAAGAVSRSSTPAAILHCNASSSARPHQVHCERRGRPPPSGTHDQDSLHHRDALPPEPRLRRYLVARSDARPSAKCVYRRLSSSGRAAVMLPACAFAACQRPAQSMSDFLQPGEGPSAQKNSAPTPSHVSIP
jgi:hypothetical protein